MCLKAFQSKAQQADSTPGSAKHSLYENVLLLKAKKQKTTAWILLGAGTGLAITGIALISNDKTPYYIIGAAEQPKHSAVGPVLTVAGIGSTLGSIPFFIASRKNKRKASLMIKKESVFFNPRVNLKDQFIAVGLKLKL